MDEQFKRDVADLAWNRVRDIREALNLSGINPANAPRIMGAIETLESELKMARIGIWR